MNMRAIIILVLLGLLSNCQQKIETTVQYNEHFIPKKFSSLLVDTGSDNPQLNKQIIEQFNNIGVTAVNSLDLFPRVHTLDMEDLRAIYSKFDGVIQFTVKGISVHTDAAKVPSPRMDFEVSLTDVPTDSLVVTFTGSHDVQDHDHVIESLFLSIMPELQEVLQARNAQVLSE